MSSSLKDWLSFLSATTVFSTILQFLTGSLVCYKFITNKSTGDSSALPFVSGLLSCSLWLKYGLVTEERSVTIVNVVGASLFLAYVITFFVFTTNKKLLFRQFTLVLLVLITVIFYTRHETDLQEVTRVLGIVCCTVTVLFFAAPLSKIVHVFRTRNSECLPFPMIVSNFIVCLQWVIYGVAIEDKFIQVPNILGCILVSIQLSLFYFYPSRPVSGPTYRPLLQEA